MPINSTERIGKSELEVPAMAIGCWAFAGDSTWGEQDESTSIAVIRRAMDLGFTFFDTAPGYGNGKSERILGKGLKGVRERAVIANKVGGADLAKVDFIASCEKSLKLLQTDYIDLMQVHWPSREIPFEETIDALQTLKQQGKIREIGVCNFGPNDMMEWLAKGGEMASNQLPYSLLSRAIEYKIAPICLSEKVSILAYSPLLQGLLTGKFDSADSVPEGRARTRHFSGKRPQSRHEQTGCEDETFAAIKAIKSISQERRVSMAALSLAWLARQPGVASFIAGARDARQLEENSGYLAVQIEDPLDEALKSVSAKVKSKLGSDPDLWSNETRFN